MRCAPVQHLLCESGQLRRCPRVECPNRKELPGQNRAANGGPVLTAEGRLACKELVQERPQAEDVGRYGCGLAGQHLGRGVPKCSSRLTRTCIQGACGTEVDEGDPTISIIDTPSRERVVRLQVEVKDPTAVHVGHHIQETQKNVHACTQGRIA